MRIFLTGATGFVGKALAWRLRRDGHDVVAWVRGVQRAQAIMGAAIGCVPMSQDDTPVVQELSRCDAVINLAGAPVVGKRWSAERRVALRTSRVDLTARLVRAIGQATPRPKVLLSASAVGYYGDCGEAELTETSPGGHDFLATLCRDWEAAAQAAVPLGVRVCTPRLGVVLGREGGALAPMLPVFRAGAGGRLGDGRQYMPWIHLADLVDIFCHALTDARLQGPLNATAPTSVTNAAFTTALGRALHRPTLLPVPAWALRMALGDAATVMLASQRVVPHALMRHGFVFQFGDLDAALTEITGADGVRKSDTHVPNMG